MPPHIKARARLFPVWCLRPPVWSPARFGKFGEVQPIKASSSTCDRLKNIVLENDLDSMPIRKIAVGDTEVYFGFFRTRNCLEGPRSSTVATRLLEARYPTIPLDEIVDDIELNRVRFFKVDVDSCWAPISRSLFQLRNEVVEKVERAGRRTLAAVPRMGTTGSGLLQSSGAPVSAPVQYQKQRTPPVCPTTG